MNIADCGGAQYRETRRCLIDHPLLAVEAGLARGAVRRRTDAVLTVQPQVVIPLHGAFVFHLGASSSLLTANHALLIEGGAVSQDSFVDEQRIGFLLLTPRLAALRELPADILGAAFANGAVASRVVNAPAGVQRAASAIWNLGCREADDSELEEAAFELLDVVAAAAASRPGRSCARQSALVAQVKELIGAGRERLSLASIAAQLRASPAYLTDLFRRSEGISIAHYHRRLRLARALMELPDTDDITALALDLGFSSHSHFSTAFRSTYGETPSRYRARMRLSRRAAARVCVATARGAFLPG